MESIQPINICILTGCFGQQEIHQIAKKKTGVDQWMSLGNGLFQGENHGKFMGKSLQKMEVFMEKRMIERILEGIPFSVIKHGHWDMG